MAEVKPLIWGFREAQYCPSCQSAARRRAMACGNDLRALGLAVLADARGFRVGDVLADVKALAKALSEGIIEELVHGEEEKS
jgi:hypothetical protein